MVRFFSALILSLALLFGSVAALARSPKAEGAFFGMLFPQLMPFRGLRWHHEQVRLPGEALWL